MHIKSRRRAREAALRALYEIELGHGERDAVIQASVDEVDLPDDQAQYASRAVLGFFRNQSEIDNRLSRMIREYDFDRIAVIDRNILRLAAYELLDEPTIPPAVTINEAVEIAKKYSTSESGRFVNGVLGSFLKSTPKVDWDPSQAADELPEEHSEKPSSEPEEIEEVVVEEGSAEAITAKRFGAWTVRAES